MSMFFGRGNAGDLMTFEEWLDFTYDMTEDDLGEEYFIFDEEYQDYVKENA